MSKKDMELFFQTKLMRTKPAVLQGNPKQQILQSLKIQSDLSGGRTIFNHGLHHESLNVDAHSYLILIVTGGPNTTEHKTSSRKNLLICPTKSDHGKIEH